MHTRLVTLALLTLSQGAFAQVPSAGSQLRQIPAAPSPEKSAPQFRIEPGAAAVAGSTDNTTFAVSRLNIVNARAFSASELIAVSGFQPGSQMDLGQLRGLAAKITDHYRSHGYFLAQAQLPAQNIVDGAVTIAVVEGQYGKVVVRNDSNLSDGLAQSLVGGLNSGDAITIAPLESRLLQLSDLPGVNVKSTLTPGASVGASDLIIDVTPGKRVTGSVDADNAGSRYTGAYRVGGTVNLNNLAGQGDVASLRALTSFDGLNYGRAAYQMQFGKADAGVAYTALDYELGREFESLDAHGNAQIASLYGRYPLQRSRNGNVYAQVNVDAKKFRDELEVTTPATIANKKAQVAMLSLVGDRRDGFGGGGLTSYSLTWSAGSLDLESAQARSIDATTARTDGHYDKFGINLMRLQSVTESLSLYAAVQGQLAPQNLDVSEKLGLGGANGVRAFPEGEAYIDEGYLVNLEARYALPTYSNTLPGQFQLVGFLDSGNGKLNNDRFSAERNRRTLSGGGVGVNWFDAGRFVVKASYAHKIGAAIATSAPDKDGRFWINAVTYF